MTGKSRFHSDENGTAPFFLFGDFNFRTDSKGVIQKLCEGLQPIRLQSNKTDHTKLQYQDEASQVIFSLGRKEFSHHDHQTLFIENEASWLKAFDRELEPFEGRLYEFPISFPPSYPFEEEEEKGPRSYMQTRCPSWCDRVVLSSSAKSLVNNILEPGSVEYGLVGPNTCMGDHKPVYLRLLLAAGAGRVECCTSPHQNAWPCTRSMSLQADHLFVPDAHQPLYASLSVDVNYLPLPCTTHEPYTPESVDTPSPAPSSPLHVESLQDKLKLFVEQQSGDVVDSNLKLDVGSDDKQLINCTKFTDAHITKSSNFSLKSDFIDTHNLSCTKSIDPKNSNCPCLNTNDVGLDTNDVIDTWIVMEHCDTNVPYILEPNLTIGDRPLHLDETSPKHNKYTSSMEDEPPEIRKSISLIDDQSSNAVKDDLLKNDDICSPSQRTAPWLISKKYDTWRGSREQEVNRCHSDTLLKRKSMQICRLCGQLCPSSQFWLKNQRSLSDKNLHWLCDNWKKNCETNRIPFLITADYLHSTEKTSTCGTQQNELCKAFPVLKCDRLVKYTFDDKIERRLHLHKMTNFTMTHFYWSL
ncbi:unnamed protein product [Timema podura]|uniref:inositol-polyphosphate 5-phosphatase n=1 Tax=Timema podura TaxID=61482 RepID=A0ABN7ND53_TIMPD|nr:unnamed protein product [Timema podura]